MLIRKDAKGHCYIEWTEAPRGCKRAWIQCKSDTRYLTVAPVQKPGAKWRDAIEFPILSPLSDEQILLAFVTSVSSITGCALQMPPQILAKVDPLGEKAKPGFVEAKVDPLG